MKKTSSSKKYIYNDMPMFNQPNNNKKRPSFIYYAMKRASDTDVARSELNYIIQPKNIHNGKPLVRLRRLNEHRARAMRAMVQAMLYHVNIVSQLVYASIEQLSDECGLSTLSQAGNKSITRASRLISEFMEPMGYVICKKSWDNILGTYMPKMIQLTPLFFSLFGVSLEKINNAKRQRLGWINKNLKEKGMTSITLMEAKWQSKENRLQSILQYRKSHHVFNQRKKHAKKLFSLKEHVAKQKILQVLVKQYTLTELSTMGLHGLRKKVNIQYYYLRKLATTPYPNNPFQYK